MPTRSRKLRARLDLLKPVLTAAGRQVLGHPSPAEFYPHYIATMHGISRAAVPLMEAAVQRIDEQYRQSPWAQPYSDYLRHHIPEETGHDTWALEDLEVIGIARQRILDDLPMATIAAMVGAQYYWIHHVSPIALIGYLCVMEANPPTPAAVEQLRNLTGFPEAAFRSMAIHARVDVRHEAEIFALTDVLPLDDRSEQLLILSALHTTELLAQALSQLATAEFRCLTGTDGAGAQ